MSFYCEVDLDRLGESSPAELGFSVGAETFVFCTGDWLYGEIRLNTDISKPEFYVDLKNKSFNEESLFEFLREYAYQFSLLFYQNSTGRLHVLKDFSGCEAGYYKLGKNKLAFSSDVDLILKYSNKAKLNDAGVFEFIYLEVPWKPTTLFEDVYATLNGTICTLRKDFKGFSVNDKFNLRDIEEKAETSPQLLRDQITLAHQKRLGDMNAIFLSGGIDSQVMSIALKRDLGIDNLIAYNFSVLGAKHSEQNQAREASKELNIEFFPVEIDPDVPIDFEQLILGQNSPYLGSVFLSKIFGDGKPERSLTFFAGQDSRITTPSLSKEDLIYWKVLSMPNEIGLKFATLVSTLFSQLDKILDHSTPGTKRQRLLQILRSLHKPEDFLALRYFHVHDYKFIHDEIHTFEPLLELKSELSKLNFRKPRRSYNQIVELNWRRQHLFDIEYMTGLTRSYGHDCVLPFFDQTLAEYSASLNFGDASRFSTGRAGHSRKRISVNKYILRKAYEKDLNRDLIYRDKAVCPTNYLFFNGALVEELDDFIFRNRLKGTSLGERIKIDELIKIAKLKHRNWSPEDNSLLITIFNALVCCKLAEKYNV